MRLLRLILATALALQLASCKSTTVKPESPIKKIAVASIAVTAANLTPTVRTEPLQNILDTTSDDIVRSTEEELATIMQVANIAGFVENPLYRNSGVKEITPKNDNDYMTPRVKGRAMPLFSTNDHEITWGTLKPEVARKLCEELKVDAVLLLYSEWSHDSQGFVPMQRAYTVNIATVWDKRGDKIFSKRVDTYGVNYIGAPIGPIVVTRGNIHEWSNALAVAFNQMLPELARLSD